MNYIFNVLWFEDNVGWYGLEKIQLESIVEEHCLKCNISRKRGSDFNVTELLHESFDLILMDYDLATEQSGEKIICDIREENVFTDILFYSSQYDAMIAAIKDISPPIDGVYYSNRKIEEFHEKLSGLIAKIVQRSENLINLRGFVLDNTSDFELRTKEILNICWQKFSEEQQSKLVDGVNDLLNKKCRWIKKQIEVAKKQDEIFVYSNNNDHLLSISDRLDLFQIILPILSSDFEMPKYICPTNFKEFYIESVNMYRNRLGHIKLGEKTIHIKGNDVAINRDFHRLLRKNIAAVEETIFKIEQYITQNI